MRWSITTMQHLRQNVWIVYLHIWYIVITASSGVRECLSKSPRCVSSFDLQTKFPCPGKGRFTHTTSPTMFLLCLSRHHMACECRCGDGKWFDDILRSCRKRPKLQLNLKKRNKLSQDKAIDYTLNELYNHQNTITNDKPGIKLKHGQIFGSDVLHTNSPGPEDTTEVTYITEPPLELKTIRKMEVFVEKNYKPTPRHRHKHGSKYHHKLHTVADKLESEHLDKEPDSEVIVDSSYGYRYIVHGKGVLPASKRPKEDDRESKNLSSTNSPLPITVSSITAGQHISTQPTINNSEKGTVLHNKTIFDSDVYIQRWVPNQLDIPRAERLVGVPNLGLQFYEDTSPVPAWAVALMALCLVILLVIIVLVMY